MSRQTLKQLVARCQQGDESAWDDLMDYVRPVVFSICRQKGLASQECLDVFGHISYKLVTHIDQVASPGKVLSYVATATHRRVANLFRASKFIHYVDGSVDVSTDSPGDRPDQALELNRRIEALKEALLQLSPREKELITALFLERGRPDYKAVAERLRMPVSSIGPTRARTLEKLRKILEKKNRSSRIGTAGLKNQ